MEIRTKRVCHLTREGCTERRRLPVLPRPLRPRAGDRACRDPSPVLLPPLWGQRPDGGAQPGVSSPWAVDAQWTSVGPAELPAVAQILRENAVAQPLSPGLRD